MWWWKYAGRLALDNDQNRDNVNAIYHGLRGPSSPMVANVLLISLLLIVSLIVLIEDDARVSVAAV